MTFNCSIRSFENSEKVTDSLDLKMPENTDAGMAANDWNSPPNADSTIQEDKLSPVSEDAKGPPGPRYGHWRRGCRHHHHGHRQMPLPSDTDVPMPELTADEKERYSRYRMWEKYYEQRFPGQNFPGHPDYRKEGEQQTFPFGFDGPIHRDQQFGKRPFPYHHYHYGYYHCGGRFNRPKPTLQERLQREFDFI